ncbi:unnamed protein product (macronuclear) [Paramecium tetraurelia]|uniref:Transmembrane protein n=1 Tax=Paramecium tetraurelia TaxID=5888 RepID=A0BYE8_PARTE|nr:uncharacterized protein GSPATT00033418001 [Paramecium tetraurelia]CAK63565.1 unnamed protein product [Paramecium tetraurelia]|eukprot:XP_001430963.1 hypothetical protein (macronuclear) [Paramecium tetraurelia strain d4-2]
MNFIFYFYLLQNVLNTQIKRPQVSILNETLTPSNYNLESQKEIEILYGNILDMFSINLHKRISGKVNNVNFSLGEFEKVDPSKIEDCKIIQRDVEIRRKLKLWIDKTGITEGVYITDIAISEQYSQAFIVRNDFKLFQLNFNSSAYGIYLRTFDYSFYDILNLNEIELDDTPQLIIDDQSNKAYIFTQSGGVSFQFDFEAQKEIQINLEDQIQQRHKIFCVHYNEKHRLVFVATGHQGVDVYKLSNGTIMLKPSINSLFLNYAQIIDIKSDGGDNLYILDREQGLIFCLIIDEYEYEYQFLINIPDAKSFDFNNNTFFVVAKTSNKQDYALEILVNLQAKQYYINNHYFDDMIINEVSVLNYYAILIGQNDHKIVQHSIYSGFIESKVISHKSFYEPQLIKTKKFKQNNLDFSNLQSVAVIGRQEFQILNLIISVPSIKCQKSEKLQSQFLVDISSTRCTHDQIETTTQGQLTLCKIQHSFTIQNQVLGQSEVKNVLNIIICWFIALIFYLRYFERRRQFTGLKMGHNFNQIDGIDLEMVEQNQLIS